MFEVMRIYLITILLFGGCVSPQNPEKTLTLGMSEEAIRRSIGEPSGCRKISPDPYRVEVWTYYWRDNASGIRRADVLMENGRANGIPLDMNPSAIVPKPESVPLKGMGCMD